MSDASLKTRKEAWSGGETRLARKVARPMVRFLAQEAASGLLLLVATAAALIWANISADSYHHFWETEIGISVGGVSLFEHDGHPLPLEAWVNDALMVLFFFVVGLEIKSELVMGDLKNPRVAALPAIAAIGGMIIPAGLYAILNIGGDGIGGWGIPMATDIAFAVGVLALIGSRVPQKLKLFLLTLAIADDIGAILVIAVFYTANLNFGWLGLAGGLLVAIYLLNRARIWYTPIYVVLGIVVWYATFRSGVHATIAGVVLGLMAPAMPLLGKRAFEGLEDIISGESAGPAAARDASWKARESVAVTDRLLTLLSPWTGFVIIPVFALANAGVVLSRESIADATGSMVTWGIILGLVVGKPVGVVLFTWFGVRSKIATLPDGVTMRHVLGGGAVAGIGFTVALFIGSLAFGSDAELADQATIGVLVASFLAAGLGWLILGTGGKAENSNSVEAKPDGIVETQR